MNKYYVTTPIYYATAAPHLGSLYSTVIADVIVRWAHLQGKKTFFLTGTDEHGQKIAQAAAKIGKKPKEFIDDFIPAYKALWKRYNIHYSKFIRTTDIDHVEAVQQWIKNLQEKGDIYKAFYQGWYCIPDETFITEKEVTSADEHGVGPACPSCGRPTQFLAEETYFFKLSKYQDALLQWYQTHPEFIMPKERTQEVINFVKEGLKDLSISRTTITWGIPFPGDEKHVTYVWADALNNYITGVGYGNSTRTQEFHEWWPADVHVMGKDIIRFHAIYWPAFLMASGLEIPHHLLVHGWIKVNEQKMSKSLGNVVDPNMLCDAYGADAVRYYLMRHMAITHDGDFSIQDLEQRISSDLANDLGNLLNRCVSLALQHGLTQIQSQPNRQPAAQELQKKCQAMLHEYNLEMEHFMFHMALAHVWKFINAVNAYFHEQEPWKVAKQDKQRFEEIIGVTCHSLRAIAYLVWPVMPEKMEQLLESLGIPFDGQTLQELNLGQWHHAFTLKKTAPLFEKPVEKKQEQPMEQPTIDYIAIDDLTKVQLVVGAIEQVEIVPNSDKLLKMQVDFGSQGKRQILAGIRASYKPEDLVGKQGIFVFNLKPRMMLGMESQGMMLVAEAEDGKMKMATVAQTVPNGSRLR